MASRKLAVLQFPHLQVRSSNRIYLIRLLGKLHELILIKHLPPCPAHRKDYVSVYKINTVLDKGKKEEIRKGRDPCGCSDEGGLQERVGFELGFE